LIGLEELKPFNAYMVFKKFATNIAIKKIMGDALKERGRGSN
jgi:hypothetical protein